MKCPKCNHDTVKVEGKQVCQMNMPYQGCGWVESDLSLEKIEGLGSAIKSVEVAPHFTGAEQMIMTFENGFGLSILSGGSFGLYTKGGTFEVGILGQGGGLSTVLGEGTVYGYQTAEEVAGLARRVSFLKAPQIASKA